MSHRNRRNIASILTVILVFGVVVTLTLTLTSCSSQPQTWDLITTNDPEVAEDAFYAAVKRIHDQRDKVDPLLIEQFKSAARDVWRDLEQWRTIGTTPATYQQHWATMVEKGLAVEAAALLKGDD